MVQFKRLLKSLPRVPASAYNEITRARGKRLAPDSRGFIPSSSCCTQSRVFSPLVWKLPNTSTSTSLVAGAAPLRLTSRHVHREHLPPVVLAWPLRRPLRPLRRRCDDSAVMTPGGVLCDQLHHHSLSVKDGNLSLFSFCVSITIKAGC